MDDRSPPADEEEPTDGSSSPTEDVTDPAASANETAAGRHGSDETDTSENAADSTDQTDPAEQTDSTDSVAQDDTREEAGGEPDATEALPEDVRSYERFQKIDGGTYERANDFLRERTYITAREWAIARLCADFRTETGVEMTKIGENLPELVPFMTDTYSPQAVNQARASFEEKVRMAGATFLYGAMSDFFTADELDDLMYEATEVAKFLLEVEGVELSVGEELEAEDRISEVMREVRDQSVALRHDEAECPECGHTFEVAVDE